MRNARKLGCLLSAAITCSHLVAAAPATDPQFWTEVDTTVKLSHALSTTFLGTVRSGDGLPNPTLWGGGPLLDFVTGPWTFSAGLLIVEVRGAATGTRRQVELPLAAVSYSFNLFGLVINDRNRLEKLDGAPGAPLRYRNRLLIDRPLRLPGISHMFVSDEAFCSLQTHRWTRNRCEIGAGFPLRSSVELQLFYLRQDDRGAKPHALNVAGTTLKLSF